MSKTKITTIAPVQAMSGKDADAAYWKDVGRWADKKLAIDLAILGKMDMRDLKNLSAVLGTARSIMLAFGCQPRFNSEASRVHNVAGDLIDGIVEFLESYRETIVRVAMAAAPTDPEECKDRAWTIVGFEADLEDNLLDLGVMVAEENRTIATAKFREARKP